VLEIAATQGIVGLAALTWVLFVLGRGTWRGRLEPSVPGLAGALVGYSVWVFFNFDWAPATGPFWLLAGTLWSVAGCRLPNGEGVRERRVSWRQPAALVLALVAIPTAVFPVLADVWYLRGRPDLSVRVDPLQAQYHWALGTVPELQRAADLGETDPSMYVQLGDGYAKVGNGAQAVRAYERALEIDPFYSPARQRLGALG